MLSYQEEYARILESLMNNPNKVTTSRIGDIHSRFVELIRVDLTKEFPLMDIKKIQFSNILHELLWFLKGDTNVKYLVNNGCNIWTDDAYRYYLERMQKRIDEFQLFKTSALTKAEFVEHMKSADSNVGDMGRIYGKQWREFNGRTDQLKNCIDTLKTNPNDRRMIVSAHNPTDIEDGIVGLPSCHNMFQFYTIPLTFEQRLEIKNSMYDETIPNTVEMLDELNIPKHKLNLWFNIRSNDFFLGQPYNMASYAILCHIIANIVNMIPNEIVCTMIDCHLYIAHMDAANTYLKRYYHILLNNEDGVSTDTVNTYCKSILLINRQIKDIDDVKFSDFELINYNPMPYIKAPLLT